MASTILDFAYKVYHRIENEQDLSSIQDSSDVQSGNEVFIAKKILLRNIKKNTPKLASGPAAKEASSSTTSTSKSQHAPRSHVTRSRYITLIPAYPIGLANLIPFILLIISF